MNEKEILENYLKKRQELEDRFLNQIRRLDEEFLRKLQTKLVMISEIEERVKQSDKFNEILNPESISEAEQEYWKVRGVDVFLLNLPLITRGDKSIRARLLHFLKQDTGIHTVSDLLSLTEEQYGEFVESWSNYGHYLFGKKTFEFLKNQLASKGLKFSEKKTSLLVPSPKSFRCLKIEREEGY